MRIEIKKKIVGVVFPDLDDEIVRMELDGFLFPKIMGLSLRHATTS